MFEFNGLNDIYEVADCKIEKIDSIETGFDGEFEISTIYKYVLLKSKGSEKNILVIREFEEPSDEEMLYDAREIVIDVINSVKYFKIVSRNILKGSIVISKCPYTTSDINILNNIEFKTIDEYIDFLNNIRYRHNHKYTKLENNEFISCLEETKLQILNELYSEISEEEVEISEKEDAILEYYNAAGFDFRNINEIIDNVLS